MNKIKAQTLKGFRDFLSKEARKRQYVINILKGVFESFGFEPLETPALEYAETLKGKYGEEEKLIYEFTTRGGGQVALRYDQTVPLARVVAQYSELPKPFKRYQIQPVWRGESPQKGRFREFLQCDIDIVGSSSPLADAEIVACTVTVVQALGFKNAYVEVNDRGIFGDLDKKYISAIDKLKKISEEGVMAEMVAKGMPKDEASRVLKNLQTAQPTSNLRAVFEELKIMGFEEDKDFKFTPTLARGLDYYTGSIFELISPEYGNSSLAGGGRYDKLIGQYSETDLPATGISFGFDRIVEAMTKLQLLPEFKASTKVLVTIFSPELVKKSLETVLQLRSKNINTEVWLNPEDKLEKQLKYADQKEIPYVIIIGSDEASSGQITLKNLVDKTQRTLSLDEACLKLSS